MSWYNCWLAHSWGRWENRPVRVRDYNYLLAGSEGAFSEWRTVDGQERACQACNKRQLRVSR